MRTAHKVFLFAILFALTQHPVKATAQDLNDLLGGVIDTVIRAKEEEDRKKEEAELQKAAEVERIRKEQEKLAAEQRAKEEQARLVIKQIQTALTTLGFYSGVIDGLSGPGTRASIKAWEDAFEQNIDEQLDQGEFTFLIEVSKSGFTTKSEFDEARAAGFSTRSEYDDFKKTGFESKDELLNAQASGFTTKNVYDEAHNAGFYDNASYNEFKDSGFDTKDAFDVATLSGFYKRENLEKAKSRGFTNRNEFVNHEVNVTKHLLDDIQLFLPDYKGDIDIVKVTKLVKNVEPLANGQWEWELLEQKDELQSYMASLPGFEELQSNKVKERANVQAQQKADLIAEYKDMKAFLNAFVRKNLTDDRTATIAEVLEKLDDVDKNTPMKDITSEHYMAQQLIFKENLTTDYNTWHSKSGSPRKQEETPAPTPKSVTKQPPASRASTPSAPPTEPNMVIGQSFKVSGVEINILSLKPKRSIGKSFMESKPSKGAIYIAIEYSVKNISSRSISAFDLPQIHLIDNSGNRYDKDVGASAIFVAVVGADSKVLSDLNPGIQVKNAAVFEVSKSIFDPDTWQLEIDTEYEKLRLGMNRR